MTARDVRRVCLCALLFTVAVSAVAGEARIPIWEPTTITQPGKYIVTRDFSGAGGITNIIIDSADVDLDLNGMTLRNPSSAQPTIEVNDSVHRVRIHNGTLLNGNYGVRFKIRFN